MISLYLLLLPFLFALVGAFVPGRYEKTIYAGAIFGVLANALVLVSMVPIWIKNGYNPLSADGPVLYKGDEADFSIRLFLDSFGFSYLLAATLITAVITIFSRHYLHREKGYKRFFTNIQLFYAGLTVVLLAGNFETLFVGWEILGVTSFFLIAFYRQRYLPVKNALKVVSLYRIADVAILLIIWLCHRYYGFSINFSAFDDLPRVQGHLLSESVYQLIISLLILLAAMVKSAQFPFSFWLPRAMEGPTSSSAIFYGALSAHIGVFLLIRTSPIWENISIVHWIIGLIGVLSVVLASVIASVQFAIKTQIAYSSVIQIGLMFVEIALGLYWMAMIHLILNALLRSYQLLISPSVLSYKIHDQVFHFDQPKKQDYRGMLNKIKLSLLVLGIREFNMDNFMFNYLWTPLKKAGTFFRLLNTKTSLIVVVSFLAMGILTAFVKEILPSEIRPGSGRLLYRILHAGK